MSFVEKFTKHFVKRLREDPEIEEEQIDWILRYLRFSIDDAINELIEEATKGLDIQGDKVNG